jgi:hypothetical protein
MHIFIDQSGNFVVSEEKKSKVSCVASLTIPDKHMDAVARNYISLRKFWGYEEEVKGSKLSEKQISDTIALLRPYDVLVDIVCLNIGNHSPENVDKFKSVQADKLIENLTKEHHEKLVKQLHEYRERLLKLPNQLFIQATISIQLIKRILDHSPLYYCQRIPEELGNFVWFVDAKDKNTGKTPFEELWSTLLMPILESNYHMGVLEGGDYSYFHKYEIESKDMTDHQRSLMSEKSIGGVDIKKLIKEQLFFEDSSTNIGLQLVDIMSSAFCRAMNGNLNIKGWRHLGMLMVKEPSIVLLDTDKNNNPKMDRRHALVLIAMKKKRKAMLVS